MLVLAEQNRAFGYAAAASLALHALLLLNFPSLQRKGAEPLPEPPLVARLVEPAPPVPPAQPAPPPMVEEPAPPKPPPPRPAPPKRVVAPKPKAKARPLPSPPAEIAKAEAPIEAPAAPAPAPPPSTPAPAAAPPTAAIAPAAPAAPDPAEALAHFRERLREVAGRYKRYPRVAVDNGWTGDVVVRIDVAPGGSVTAIELKTSSGYEVLDAQALEMFRKAAPEVAVPAALRGRRFSVELRAVYDLRDRPS